MSTMSECRICKERGRAGVMIAWNNTIKNEKGGFIPLELDKKTKHKHVEANSTTKLPEPNNYPNPITQDTTISSKNEQNGVTNQEEQKTEDAALEALTLEFQTLVKHTLEYLKANRSKFL
jgi:hypothetical protein